MNLYLHATVALLAAFAGMVLGWWFSRLRSPYWMIGCIAPLLLVFVYLLAFGFPSILFVPPFSWILVGIKKFATLGFVATLILTTPLCRVAVARTRVILAVLMTVIVFFTSVWPFLAPLADRKQLSRLQTKMDQDGICLQGTDYTCGPAAAVTALRKLDLPADEGKVAILSCTSYQEGTPMDMLADGLRREYGEAGLAVTCRLFRNIAELKQAGLTLAVVKYRVLEDHWVTVLEVSDSEVIVGDPLAGLMRLSYAEFSRRWRLMGIVLERKMPAAASH
jgi:predicted double-glycine peptidase